MKSKNHDYDSLCYFNSLFDRAVEEFKADSKTTVNFQRWCKSVTPSKNVLEEMLRQLKCSLDILAIAVDNQDSEEREAYSYLNNPRLKKYHKFIVDSVDNIGSYLEQKYPKKVRKRKAADPEKLVKSFLFQETDEKFKSIDPKEVIGATQVALYNTKSRVLSLYRAKDKEGFSVKGCSLLGWDEKTSQSKRLRKPEQQLSHFLNTAMIPALQSFQAIKTKASVPNGRSGRTTLVLAAWKPIG